MNTTFIKKTAIAASLVAGIAAAGTAHADSLAQSVLTLTNFQFLKGGTNTQLSIGPDIVASTNPAVLFIQDSTTLGASLNNQPNPAVTASTLGGVPLGFNQSCYPASCPAGLNAGNPGAFTPITTGPVVTTGALSASNLTGAPIGGLPASSASGATAQTSALAEYKGTGTGKSASELDLATVFTFVLAQSTGVTIDFNVALNNFMYVSGGLSAQVGSGWNVTITDATGATVFKWAPDGATGGITGGTEQIDSCNLQTSFTQVGPGQKNNGTCSGEEKATTNTLNAGTAYTLTLTHTTSASVTSVPEPESVLLLGVGLAGLALARRRKAVKA